MKKPPSSIHEAYKVVFGSPVGQMVLDDLSKSNTRRMNHLNTNEMLVQEGERRVFLKIQWYLNNPVITEDEENYGPEHDH
jgi:hypothetical protein